MRSLKLQAPLPNEASPSAGHLVEPAAATDRVSGNHGGSGGQKPMKSNSALPADATKEALDELHGDVKGQLQQQQQQQHEPVDGRGSDQADPFGSGTGAGAVPMKCSRSEGLSPSQPASLESISPSFSMSSSSLSSSSSPSSSSSSALSSFSSTNIPAANGPNGINNKQLAAVSGSGGLASANGKGSSSGNSSSGNSSSSSGTGHSGSNSNMTAFLTKLWRMVNDSHNDDQIRWSQSGCSFVIINQIQFAKDMLPIYFKHSNMASFIRQLNMYGFRKIPLMNANKSGDQRADVAQFYHVNFMRGQEQRLSSIKRKNNSSRTQNLVVNGSFCDEVRAILRDVKSIRDGQNSSESILSALQLDNKSLWRDVAILRNQHHKQRRVIEKLIQFLVSLIQNRNQLVRRRRMKFMISPEDLIAAGDLADSNSNGGGSVNGADGGNAGAGCCSEAGDIMFNLSANQADEGLFQMSEIMNHSADLELQNSGNLNHNHNQHHHHHHHHPYYSIPHAAPPASVASLDRDHLMEVDDNHRGDNGAGSSQPATFADDKRGPASEPNSMHLQQGQLVMVDAMAPTASRRASSISMASVAGSNRHHQLFELGAAASPAELARVPSSSPSGLIYERPVSSLLMTQTAASSRQANGNSIEDDELMPNGATAASMSAAGSARGGSSRQYLPTSGRSASSTPTSQIHGGDSGGQRSRQQQAVSKLSQLGRENMSKLKSESPSMLAQQQRQLHHSHHLNQHPQHHQLNQIQLQHQQHQAQHQQLDSSQQRSHPPASHDGLSNNDGQLLSSHHSGSSFCYSSAPILVRAQGGGGTSQHLVFGSGASNSNNDQSLQQQQINVANRHSQRQIHASHLTLQQQQQQQHQQQQQQQQQQQLAQYDARSGANQAEVEQRQQQQQLSIDGLLTTSRRHHYNQQHQHQLQVRPTSCHPQLSQWTANSIYNSMAQPDLASMTGGGGGNGALGDGFSSMGGVFNELKVRPSFLSALELRQQAGTSNIVTSVGGTNTNEISQNMTNNGGGGSSSSSNRNNILARSVGASASGSNSNNTGRLSTTSSNNSQTYY